MRSFLATFILLIASATIAGQSPRAPLKVGDKAPEFSLPNGDGKIVTLAEYTERTAVVLVFYRGYW